MKKLNKKIRIFSNTPAHQLLQITAERLEPFSENLDTRNIKNVFSKTFPSGEIYCQIPMNVRKKNVHLISSFHRPEAYELKKAVAESGIAQEMKALLIEDCTLSLEKYLRELEKICDAARRGGAAGISIYLTYFPDSRQEKKDESRVPISSKLVLDNLQSSAEPRLRRLASVDMHAPQIQGMTNYPLDEIQTIYLFIMHLKTTNSLKDSILMLPDAGSYKRYEKIIKDFSLNYAIISKTRPNHGESRAEHYIGNSPKGKTAVIFDDIIDSGGTILNAVDSAKNLGAKDVRVYTTHGIFSTKIKKDSQDKIKDIIFAEDKFKEAGVRVYCSDSIPRTKKYREEHKEWLTQFTLAPYIADLIYCNESGSSFGKEINKVYKLALEGTKEEIEKELQKFFIY